MTGLRSPIQTPSASTLWAFRIIGGAFVLTALLLALVPDPKTLGGLPIYIDFPIDDNRFAQGLLNVFLVTGGVLLAAGYQFRSPEEMRGVWIGLVLFVVGGVLFALSLAYAEPVTMDGTTIFVAPFPQFALVIELGVVVLAMSLLIRALLPKRRSLSLGPR